MLGECEEWVKCGKRMAATATATATATGARVVRLCRGLHGSTSCRAYHKGGARRRKHRLISPSAAAGLSAYKQKYLRRHGVGADSDTDSTHSVLDTLVSSTQTAHHDLCRTNLLITHLSDAHAYRPSSDVLLQIYRSAVDNLTKLPIETASIADLAIEAFLRLNHMYDIRKHVSLLQELAIYLRQDLTLDRIPSRTWSVVRTFRSYQVAPTSAFCMDIYRNFVHSLDIQSCAAFLHYVITNRLYHNAEQLTEYYNGILYVALLTNRTAIGTAALREMNANNIAIDDETRVLHACFSMVQRQQITDITIYQAITTSKLLPLPPLPSYLYAFALHTSATIPKMLATYHNYLHRLPPTTLLSGTLSQVAGGAPYETFSEPITHASRGDATLAVFSALRRVGGQDGMRNSVRLLRQLQTEYGLGRCGGIYRVVIETCWKAGEGDVASRLREEMSGR